MSQQVFSEQERTSDFLRLYRTFRYDNQIQFYERRVKEYVNAQRQAIWLSIGLIFLTALAGAIESVVPSWLRTPLLLIAAICPILSTALAGYTALHGFTQQAKLFRDARNNLVNIVEPAPGSAENTGVLAEQIEAYVQQVEEVLQKEHSFWGQLVADLTPPGA